jgi:hypothetical protein
MKNLFAAGLFFAAAHAAAHTGHGKPGLLHFHEFSDGLMVLTLAAAVAVLWRAWKK